MRFHLIKDMQTIFCEQNHSLKRKATPTSILFTPKYAILKDSTSGFTPILSEKGSNEFWNMTTMEKCRTVLMNELGKGPMRLDPYIIITLTSKVGNGEFSVQIRDCAMLSNINKVCGDKAKLIVEIHFISVHGTRTEAGLITPEMSLGQDAVDRCKISSQASGICGSEAMRLFWEYHTCTFENVDNDGAEDQEAKPMFAVCNVLLVVDDNWPLFKTVLDTDTN